MRNEATHEYISREYVGEFETFFRHPVAQRCLHHLQSQSDGDRSAEVCEGKCQMSDVSVQSVTCHQVGERLRLVCNFTLGEDQLYSVKWYKDNMEFYR